MRRLSIGVTVVITMSALIFGQTAEQPKVLSSTCASGCAEQKDQQQKDLTGPLITFDPGHQLPQSYKDKSVEIVLMVGQQKGTGYPASWHALSLKVENLLLNQVTNIPLPDEIAQVSEFRVVPGNRIVVLGLISANASEAIIIDQASGKIKDKFYADFPSISPDGHYIAFLESTPAHISSDMNVEDHYMLYDLRKDAGQNRPKAASGVELDTVGRCFYPAGTGNSTEDRSHATPGSEHLSRSLIFWSPESRQLVFASQANSNPELNVVLASIHSDTGVGITSIDQSVEDLCVTLDGTKPVCPVLMRKATFVGGNEPRIDAIFELVKVQLLRTRSYPISRFR